MKKIVFCALAEFAAWIAFGGVAWYSEEINAILAKMPEKYYTKLNATLWGGFTGGIWLPPYAKVNTQTGKIEVSSTQSFSVTSYAVLNDFGDYDTEASEYNFLEFCGVYVVDEFGQGYTIYDDIMASFYHEYEEKNFAEAIAAFNSLESAFVMWKNDAVSASTPIDADVGKLAELTKEIDESLGKAKEEIQNAVNDTKATAEK